MAVIIDEVLEGLIQKACDSKSPLWKAIFEHRDLYKKDAVAAYYQAPEIYDALTDLIKEAYNANKKEAVKPDDHPLGWKS